MQNIINKFVSKNKYFKVVLAIKFLPIIMILFNSVVATIFNLGTFVGTFLRYIFNFVVC